MSGIFKWLPGMSGRIQPEGGQRPSQVKEDLPMLQYVKGIVHSCRHGIPLSNHLFEGPPSSMIEGGSVCSITWQTSRLTQALFCVLTMRWSSHSRKSGVEQWSSGQSDEVLSDVLKCLLQLCDDSPVGNSSLRDSIEVFLALRSTLINIVTSESRSDQRIDWSKIVSAVSGDVSRCEKVCRIAKLVVGLWDSVGSGLLRCLVGSVIGRKSSKKSKSEDWVEAILFSIVDFFDDHVTRSFCEWCSTLISLETGDGDERLVFTALVELCSGSPGASTVSRLDDDAMKRYSGSNEDVICILCAWQKKRVIELLDQGKCERALQLVGSCLGKCKLLSHELWCLHVRCLRCCGEAAAARALAKEAFDALRVDGSLHQQHRDILSLLSYAEEYQQVLQAQYQRQGTRVDSSKQALQNWSSAMTVLSDCRCFWERAMLLLSHQRGCSREELPLSVSPDDHVRIPPHAPHIDGLGHILLHWVSYKKLLNLRLWLQQATSQALLLKSSHLQMSNLVFEEHLAWIHGLEHRRWRTTLDQGNSWQWNTVQALYRRGVLLHQCGSTSDAVCLWQKSLTMMLLELETCTKERSSTPMKADAEVMHLQMVSRILLQLSDAQCFEAECEGTVEKRRKLLTDALNYAYQAKAYCRRYAAATSGASSWNALCILYHSSFFSVCNCLLKLGQLGKASILIDELLSSARHLEQMMASNEVEPSPELDHIIIETLLSQGKCATKCDPDLSLRACKDAVERAAQFTAKWLPHLSSDCTSPTEVNSSSLATSFLASSARPFQQNVVDVEENVYRCYHRLTQVPMHAALINGDACVVKRDWDSALGFFSKAYDLSQQFQQPSCEIVALQKLGQCYKEFDQTAMALQYIKQAQDIAKESGKEVLWYQSTIFRANFLSSLGKISEASSLWNEVLALAQRFGDSEVERATAKNIIRALLHSCQYYDAINSAELLEKSCAKADAVRDVVFALEALTTSYLAVGEVKKALEAVDRMEKLEDIDAAVHDTVNKLRAQALLAQRESHAAIDVLSEWKNRALTQKNLAEAAKATFALGQAFVDVSMSDAKSEHVNVLHLCQMIHSENGELHAEQRELALDAASWLVHNVYLNDDLVLMIEDDPSEEEGSPAAEAVFPSTLEDQTDSPQEEDEAELTAFVREGSSYGADDFVFDGEVPTKLEGQESRHRKLSADDILQEITEDVGRSHVQDDGTIQFSEHVSLLPCFNPRVAVEIMEAATRLLAPGAKFPVYRSPQTVAELCWRQFPEVTFVFYFLDRASSDGSAHYDVVIRPARSPFFHTTSVCVTALPDYHRKKKVTASSSQPKAGSAPEADNEGADYLYAILRALHDQLWEPVSSVAATGNIHHETECVVVMPHPTLLHVPFSSLVSPKRKAIGQRACVAVVPSLQHFMFHESCDDDSLRGPTHLERFESFLSCPSDVMFHGKKYLCLGTETAAVSRQFVLESNSDNTSCPPSSSSTFRNMTRRSALADFDLVSSMHFEPLVGSTRKELLAAITSDSTRALVCLSDPPTLATPNSNTTSAAFRMVDGDVHLSEIFAVRSSASENLELIILPSDRGLQPSVHDLGAAARLCVAFNCKRVLRIDVSQGITPQHAVMIKLYLHFLHVALSNGIRFPYAIALQAAQAEGIRKYMLPPYIWGSLTLVGAP